MSQERARKGLQGRETKDECENEYGCYTVKEKHHTPVVSYEEWCDHGVFDIVQVFR